MTATITMTGRRSFRISGLAAAEIPAVAAIAVKYVGAGSVRRTDDGISVEKEGSSAADALTMIRKHLATLATAASAPAISARTTLSSTGKTRLLVRVGVAAPATLGGKTLSGEGKIFEIEGDVALARDVFGGIDETVGGRVRYAYYG